MTQPLLQAADLRGAAPLPPDAVAGLTHLVEAMHARMAALPANAAAAAAAADEPDPGLDGLVWKTVRGVSRVSGASAAALFDWLGPALAAAGSGGLPREEREAIVAALNGLVGDHLAAIDHPLALAMTFRHDGKVLPLERFALRAQLRGASARVLVLLHDVCMNDLQWQRDGHDHGKMLASEGGYTPVYLSYNSGLSVSTSGRILAQHMERLLDSWPLPMQRLAVIGHGMGGLVARSALYHGTLIARGGLRWPARVDDLVCLGTPHQGAPLEAAGHGVGPLLGAAPYADALSKLSAVRSAGLHDLRYGNIVNGEVGPGTPKREQVPLPTTARGFALAGTTGRDATSAPSGLPDDGLVPVASALGQHREPARRLNFTAERQAVVASTSHLDLLSSPAVYAQLRRWLEA
jgi:hypothetical protein